MKMVFFLYAYLILSISDTFASPVTVRVGGYNFPPFVEEEGRAGIVRELLNKVNSSQKKYLFEFVSTSANRRYRDFMAQKFDMIMFEDESWSWKKKGIRYLASNVIAKGTEVAIALSDATRDQTYFDVLSGKKIKVVLGFHYRSHDMRTDIDYLNSIGVMQGKSHEENLAELLEKKIDVTYMNSFFLNRLFQRDKELKNKLLVKKRIDQSFELKNLIHPNSPITISELERLGLNKILVSE